MDRGELQALSRIRAKEAQALLDLGLYDGAYYLAGYAVECALKACIAKETKRYEFPDKRRADSSYTHSLIDLVRIANLDASRKELARSDLEFGENWDIVKLWSEQSRYHRHSPEKAQKLVDAVCNRRHGVLALGKATLVSIDLDIGAEVLKVLDGTYLKARVAVWLFSPDHESWFLVLGSRQFDAVGEREGYGLVNAALRKGGFPIERKPSIVILPMNDPFIRDLRRRHGKPKQVIEGVRLGPETLGDWFIEDGYAYRIS